jgi:phosphate transport system substrate-binding protein
MSSILTGKGIAFILIALVAGIGVGGLIIAPVVTAGTTSQNNLILAYELGGYQWGGSIFITGSTTVYPITQGMIGPFEAAYPTISVSAAATGSGTGYAQLDSGAQPIVAVSRPPTSTEIGDAGAAGVHMIGWTIGADAICIIYHLPTGLAALPGNLNLTKNDVFTIFEESAQYQTGTNGTAYQPQWSTYTSGAVTGGITVFTRESGSGTRGDFESYFGIQDSLMNGATVEAGNGPMVQAVYNTPGTMGYCSFAYYTPSGLAAASIAYNSSYNFYQPSNTSIIQWAQYAYTQSSGGVQNNSFQYQGTGYFACRFIYYATNGFPATGSLINKWIQFVLSPSGQSIVQSTGYVSMQEIGYLWPAQVWS